MSSTAAGRGGRPPRIRPEEVLDVLAAQADGAWTMASIAAELGVSEAAIYYYFPTKNDLLSALGQRLFSELQLPRRHDDWEGWLVEIGLHLYDFFVRCPGVATTNADVLNDAVVGAWAADPVVEDLVSAGLTVAEADTVITTVFVLASGFAIMAGYLDDPRGRRFKQHVMQHASQDPDSLVSKMQLSAQAWDIRERFTASLTAAVRGLGGMPGLPPD